MTMTPNEYQKLAARTECDQLKARWRYHAGQGPNVDLLPIRLNHAVMGLTGEVGELASIIEKWLHYGQPLDRNKLKDEAGDALWYIALLLTAAGFTMEEVMEANIRKLQVRFPDKYTDERAAVRDREAEARAVEGKVCPSTSYWEGEQGPGTGKI